jgi:DNA-binding CsgD family transcriptional regulator
MVELRAEFAAAAAAVDATALEAVGQRLQATGSWLFAAEAYALGADAWRRAGQGRRATALAARSGELRGRCEGAITPALLSAAGYEPLTRREREIAVLAASGLPSRDIAERLVLSVRTVNNHLQAVYGKLGVGGRRDLKDALIAA